MTDLPNQEEPGLDRHVWESEWEALLEDLESAPGETLPALADLVGEMLRTSGYAIDDPVASEGDAREVVDEYREARRTATALAEGGDVDPGDIGDAVEALRDIYQTLVDEPA
jgi:hypothetical protein